MDTERKALRMRNGNGRLGFQVEDITLRSRSLRPGAPPLRLAQLSDLHMRVFRKRHSRLVEVVNERKPDLLFLTGDLVSRHPFTWELAENLISQFDPRLGIFACPGNHEAKSIRRPSALKELMAGWGVILLINESHTIETESGTVRVSGLDDLAHGWPNFAETFQDGARGGYSILLSHAPLAARLIGEKAGVNLILSGHTHGGQLRIPLLWPRMLPSCHGGYPAGLYDLGWGHLYVNRGFGGSIWMPLRFRCPAEVTFFEIRPA